MNELQSDRTAGRTRHVRGVSAVLALAFLASGSIAACTGTHDSSDPAAMPTMPPPAATSPAGGMDEMPMPGAEAMWATRPAYVDTNAKVKAAYHYAINHPQLIDWMPCYCGCGEMGHQSNLACYVQPGGVAFEEHASFCDICVDITLKAKSLNDAGMSPSQIRDAIDNQFGGNGVPGTPTQLPPA